MSDAEDVLESLVEDAQGPQRVTTDAGSVEAFPLTEKLAVLKHLSNTDSVAQPHRGMRITKLVAPGAP
jgi:hypothetical protein